MMNRLFVQDENNLPVITAEKISEDDWRWVEFAGSYYTGGDLTIFQVVTDAIAAGKAKIVIIGKDQFQPTRMGYTFQPQDGGGSAASSPTDWLLKAIRELPAPYTKTREMP